MPSILLANTESFAIDRNRWYEIIFKGTFGHVGQM